MKPLGFVLAIAVLFGCATAVHRPTPEALEYLVSHHQSLDLTMPGGAVGATLLPGSADVYLLGEAHGAGTNESLDFALLTYRYDSAGVQTYIAEVGYCAGKTLRRVRAER